MREITITRALAELKLIGSKIDTQINAAFVSANKKSSGKINGIMSEEEFKKQAKSSLDSVLELIENRKQIKSKIVMSNAATMVEVNGKSMTVAEAIERKESIMFEKNLLIKLKSQYSGAIAKVNNENEKVQDKIDELLIASLGTDGSKRNQDAIALITTPYEEQNKWQLVDSIDAAKLIEKMENEILEFEYNVDFVLSESNSINKIIIE